MSTKMCGESQQMLNAQEITPNFNTCCSNQFNKLFKLKEEPYLDS